MSDTRLRDLERRWKETGTVEDEAAYLQERVRVGDLTTERLELAAYWGHEGARRSSHGEAPVFPGGLQEWAARIEREDVAATRRIALAVAEGAVTAFRKAPAEEQSRVLPYDPNHDLPERAVDALRRWVDAPVTATEAAADVAVRALGVPRTKGPTGYALRAIVLVHWQLAGEPALGTLLDYGVRGLGKNEVLTLVAARVTPWALSPRGSSS